MEVIIGAATGACATHMFNYALPTVYKQVNGVLGCNLFDLNNDTIKGEEFNELSIDPEVGYYNCTLRDKFVKKTDGTQEIIKELNCVKNTEIMDIVAKLAVLSFLGYSGYKIIHYIGKMDIDLNFDLDI